MKKCLPLVLIVFLMGSTSLFAQRPGREKFADVVKNIDSRFEPASAKPGDTVKWILTAQVEPGWHLYPTRQADPDSSYVMTLSFPNTPALELVGELVEPRDAKTIPNPDDEKRPPLQIFEGTVTWEQVFKVTSQATNGPLQYIVRSRVLVCNDQTCLQPEKLDLTAQLNITGGMAAVANNNAPPPTKSMEDEIPVDSAAYQAVMTDILGRLQKKETEVPSSLLSFILTAMFWGGVTLLTPCVFPMIPITVSFFLKQSEKNDAKPIMMAVVYCATIIVVLGAASITLLKFFSALSVNPVMNVFLGSLFIVLALSLFGMYDLTLPASLTRFTSSRESRGGVVGTIFMALTFTVVSFTCVAPFLGGFGAMAAKPDYKWYHLVLGALTFSATFAFPFFLLALFPSLIRKLPKSGSWLHSVKIVMGFVELAAGLKFLRTAELVALREPVFFTYDLVLGMWVVLSVLCGLYLLRVVRIGDAEEEATVGVPRFLMGFAFITLGIYLAPGLFAGGPDGTNHRPRGSVFAWVDAFLLPDPAESIATDLAWSGDLRRALEAALNEQKRTGQVSRVFIDFTGETCSNCKLNEREIFTRPEIKDLFRKFRLVKLYTDKVPDSLYSDKVRGQLKGAARQQADAAVNARFKADGFDSEQLPLYVILEPKPDGTIVVSNQYAEGKINRVDQFVDFLKSGIGESSSVASARGVAGRH